MQDWTTNQWMLVILPFLIGLFVGLMMCSGRKWKQRYKDEVRLRTEERKRLDDLEARDKHHQAELIAARARADTIPPAPHADR